MADRDLSLTPRPEAVRDIKKVVLPIHFTLDEIENHFRDSLEDIRRQLVIADELQAKDNDTANKVILRSQVVLSEGVMDFLIHEVSKYCIFRMFVGEQNKSEKYGNIMIPMSAFERGINSADSNEWFFEYLNARFSRDVFLSVESMRDQLNLSGVSFSEVLARAFPKENSDDSIKTGKNEIKNMFQRRNEIAHQNDRSHATSEQNDITRKYVEDYLDKVERIGNAIVEILREQE